MFLNVKRVGTVLSSADTDKAIASPISLVVFAVSCFAWRANPFSFANFKAMEARTVKTKSTPQRRQNQYSRYVPDSEICRKSCK